MTKYIDFEERSEKDAIFCNFDLVVIGGGPAGLTIVRELAGQGLNIAVLESGGLEETPFMEMLNEVDVSTALQNSRIQHARREQHGPQLMVWKPEIQKYGVRCRVLGGSSAGWAGKVAPFDTIDYEARPWIPAEGWPIGISDVGPYMKRAAEHLDLGPLLQGAEFWKKSSSRQPAELSQLRHFGAFFWQFARSRHALTDVMRFGDDFRREDHKGVTVFLNATAASVKIEGNRVSEIDVVSSLTGRNRKVLKTNWVVLAAGAIENARLLLLSQEADPQFFKLSEATGRHLMDHPSIHLGEFAAADKDKAAKVLGFYPVQQSYRVYMYSCGLALTPEAQKEMRMPNMAIFAAPTIAADDPLQALSRLVKSQSAKPVADLVSVVKNFGFVITSVGRKLISYRRIPERLRRLIADAAVFIDANMVAREYAGGGRGRRIERVALNIISEQPPQTENRVTLSDRVDRLGLRLAHIQWEIPSSLRHDVIRFARLLAGDLNRANIKGFEFDPSFEADDGSELIFCDMAHTAGTTRMGNDPKNSVVDPSLQLHGVRGLYVAGASVFPTSGHANPTLMILALAVRLADTIKKNIVDSRLEKSSQMIKERAASKPLVVVTGATGNLGREVVEQLAERGYRIRGQFRNAVPSDNRVEWVQCDFADPDLSDAVFDSLLDGASAVIHLAASLSNVAEMQVANISNLERLVKAGERNGIRYFGLATSMAVYGSPTTRVVTESTPRIDLAQPIEKQYFAEYYMREYARSKIIGEDILSRHSKNIHVDLYRIAVAQGSDYLQECLNWSAKRALFSLYRNSHFISSRNVARAVVHLMEKAIETTSSGVEVYNIADTDSPTFAEIYRQAGRKTGFNIPLLLDVLKGVKIGRTFALRYPMGFFRLDNRKLQASGFDLERADLAFLIDHKS